ncbi:MAG: threonine synthase [Candidatus Melainabacteria bacterium]|nr:threonine synthase [Candidatus Melainabacteria bacterium]
MHSQYPLIERYRDFLPVSATTPIISLGEGNTPLIRASNLHHFLGAPSLKLYLKLEGLNPTGSFKDRGMTLAISKAVESGAKAVICASTGNTSASAAAFATKAGLTCYVLLPHGHVALGKLAQAILYGARIIPIKGNFDQALEFVRNLADQCHITIVNSVNPYRLEGQKTAAFEVVEQLEGVPDYLLIPVGNAGNISAYWRGFKLLRKTGGANATPHMFGFEAQGAAAIVRGQPIANPETIATAIRIGNPASWQEAIKAASESDGQIDSVTDDQIIEAYKLLAKLEGIFCEPSSAACLAGLIKHLSMGTIAKDATVVCVLTGNGLKDPDTPLKVSNVDLAPVEADLQKLKTVMGF